MAQINGSHLLGTFGCSRGHRIRLIGGLHTFFYSHKAGATLAWLANAPGVRGCSALRARADVFLARRPSSVNAGVGLPGLRSMRESCAAIFHSHPARLLSGLVLRTGQNASPFRLLGALIAVGKAVAEFGLRTSGNAGSIHSYIYIVANYARCTRVIGTFYHQNRLIRPNWHQNRPGKPKKSPAASRGRANSLRQRLGRHRPSQVQHQPVGPCKQGD